MPPDPYAESPDEELERLTSLLLEAAGDLIAQGGGFLPFAARLHDGGEAELIPPVLDEDELENPDPAAVLEVLEEALRMDALAGLLRCGGTCTDVLVDLPGEGRLDAARVAVEHRDGPSAVTLLPYAATADGGPPALRPAVRTPGDAVLFASDPG